MLCPACGRHHETARWAQSYVPTRAGYLLLATLRAEENARKLTAGGASRPTPAQASGPSSDVAGGFRETTTGADAAAARVPITGGHDA